MDSQKGWSLVHLMSCRSSIDITVFVVMPLLNLGLKCLVIWLPINCPNCKFR